MDRVCHGNAGIFIPLVQKSTLETCLEESMKRRQSDGLCGKPRDVNKPGMFVQ